MGVDILMLELPRSDRDLNLSVPVFLELKRRGLNVVLENLEFSYLNLTKYQPKLVFFSSLNDSVVIDQKRLLFELGIPVISATTEGNFQERGFHGYFWGWNKDYKFYQDRLLLWNEKSRGLIVEKHPEFADRLDVTGSVGHDRYKTLPFMAKADFLSQRGLKFERIVGLAGFGLFKYIDRIEYVEAVDPEYPVDQFALFEKDREILRRDYLALARANPNILFIARVHPELASILHESEFTAELLAEPNVLLSSTRGELKSIDDVLSVCDLWIGYETNSSIEAWLMDRPVLYYNPTTADFQRENHHTGVLILSNLARLQDAIDELYGTGSIAAYEALHGQRKALTAEVIGFDDGCNYYRAADAIERHFRTLSTPLLSLRYARLLARKPRRVLREALWHKEWYWKLRSNLRRPDALFYPARVFAEEYIGKYEPAIAAQPRMAERALKRKSSL